MSGGSSDRSPRGAAGMAVQFESGRKMLCKANSKGVALGGSSIDDTASCVKTNFALREPYGRAIGNGCKVELHSKSEVRRGEQANAMREAGNARGHCDRRSGRCVAEPRDQQAFWPDRIRRTQR